jgi:hypothetical protein
MALYEPSIWDYIAQAGSAGVQGFGDARKDALDRAERERQAGQGRDMQLLQIISQGVQDGSIFSNDANANPMASKRGLVFRPSQPERAATITSRPFKSITTSPGVGTVPIITPQPWTADDRRLAGLPTADAMAVEAASGAKARAEGPVAGFNALDPVLSDVAKRFVAQAMNGGTNVERFPAVVANGAYNAWIQNQRQAGDLSINDPGKQAYAKAFFDKAVREEIARLTAERIAATRADNTGSSSDNTPAMVNALENMKKNALGPYASWGMLSTERLQKYLNPDSPQYNASMAAAFNKRDALTKAQNEILSGRISPETRALMLGLGGETDAPTIPANGPPIPGIGTPPVGDPSTRMTPQQMIDESIAVGRQIPVGKRQAWFDRGKVVLTPEQARKIAKALGVKP